MIMHYYWTSWISLAALVLYFWTIALVGMARGKYQIKAPEVDGPDAFRRILRVQLNTLEQLALFLPLLWLCALWQNDYLAAVFGLVWLAGRLWYALGYISAASRRGPGFVTGALAQGGLLLATAAGLLGWTY